MSIGLAGILAGIGSLLGEELLKSGAKETVKLPFDAMKGPKGPTQMQLVGANGQPVDYNQGGPVMNTLPMAPPQPPQQQQGLGQMMAPQQQQPGYGTKLRRGLGDALMSAGAIGLGQDPFRAVATVRQQRFQQQRAEQEDQQRQEDIQREGAYRTEDMEARRREIAEKYGFEREKIGLDQQNRQEEFAYQREQDAIKRRMEEIKFQMQMAQTEQARQQAAVQLQMEQARLNIAMNEAAAKEQERKNKQQLMAMYGQWLGLMPPGSAEMIGAVNEPGNQGQPPESSLAPASGPLPSEAAPVAPTSGSSSAPPPNSPLAALPKEQQQLVGALMMAGDVDGALKMASNALANQQKIEKPTESEGKARGFVEALTKISPSLDTSEDTALHSGMFANAILGKLPLGNYVQSDEYRKYQTDAWAWASQYTYAVSGAQAPEQEVQRNFRTFIVQPEDLGKPDVIARKRELRASVTSALKERYMPINRAAEHATTVNQGGQELSDEDLINKYK